MKANFESCLKALLAPGREGGFVNHPADPGGMTNMGVTRANWSAWIGREASEKEMRALTVDKVAPFYKRKYWDKIEGDSLPAGVDHTVFDFAVNSGPGRAAKMLQAILKVPADGAIGPKTLTALAAVDGVKFIEQYNDERQRFLESLLTFNMFGKGWSRRVSEIESEALSMLA